MGDARPIAMPDRDLVLLPVRRVGSGPYVERVPSVPTMPSRDDGPRVNELPRTIQTTPVSAGLSPSVVSLAYLLHSAERQLGVVKFCEACRSTAGSNRGRRYQSAAGRAPTRKES